MRGLPNDGKGNWRINLVGGRVKSRRRYSKANAEEGVDNLRELGIKARIVPVRQSVDGKRAHIRRLIFKAWGARSTTDPHDAIVAAEIAEREGDPVMAKRYRESAKFLNYEVP